MITCKDEMRKRTEERKKRKRESSFYIPPPLSKNKHKRNRERAGRQMKSLIARQMISSPRRGSVLEKARRRRSHAVDWNGGRLGLFIIRATKF
ncbi:hypothetical protein Taro_011308 [Colocasia esculenta]|uniref:Uncharacterized protein n=1 Tax=Colocasia esculenta TaxID=4460 RepID=A0A843UA85_COLES|nr:hypothetical protein [Colocasia esculenta]